MLPTQRLEEMIALGESALAAIAADAIMKGVMALRRGRLGKTSAQGEVESASSACSRMRRR